MTTILLPGERTTAPLLELFLEVEGDPRTLEETAKRFSQSLYLSFRRGRLNFATHPHTFRALKSRLTEEVLLALQGACTVPKEANMNLIFHNLDARRQSLFLAYFNTQGEKIKKLTGRAVELPPHKVAGENLLVLDGLFPCSLEYEEIWAYIEFLIALYEYFLVSSVREISHYDFTWWVKHRSEVHTFPNLLFRLSEI